MIQDCFRIGSSLLSENQTDSNQSFTFFGSRKIFLEISTWSVQFSACLLLLLCTFCILLYLLNLVGIFHSRVWKDQPQYTQLFGLGMLDVLSLFVTFYELLCSVFLHEGMLPEIASKQAFLFKQYCEYSELALLLVIALSRMCAILFPFKIKLILTPRVSMVSVLSVVLLYGPCAVVLSLDCLVGYKPRVMSYGLRINLRHTIDKRKLLTGSTLVHRILLM